MKPNAVAPQPIWASPAFVGAAAASFFAHAAVLALFINGYSSEPLAPIPVPPPVQVILLAPEAPSPPHPLPAPPTAAAAPQRASAPPTVNAPMLSAASIQALPAREPASMDAPPPPSAEEWQQAAGYTLKNSKRYRYAWGQQVRSMMGTAVEGPEQGEVRFRVEIAPDGHLARLETLWSTSDTAERLAREAMGRMPPLPPTPTGKPLVFEKTIAFRPFDTGWPPIYQYDCLPDPPGFKNPFAWNGSGDRPAPIKIDTDPADNMTAAEREECLKSLPPDTLEAVTVDQERQFKTWGSLPLNGVK